MISVGAVRISEYQPWRTALLTMAHFREDVLCQIDSGDETRQSLLALQRELFRAGL